MGQRIDLQRTLETILGSDNVYFQPPPTIRLDYPCIVYKRSSGDTQFADDKPYTFMVRYTVTLIQRHPESAVFDKIAALPMCTYDRFYATDGLNHDVFNLYF